MLEECLIPLKPHIILSERVQAQIRYLCKQIVHLEWSGILLYNTEGKFGQDDFKCILEDIFLMDVGTHTDTHYEFNQDVAGYMMDNPRLLQCKIAHIHSHNTMGVFFSDVDMGELHTNSPHHNFYLSLIVNNENEMTAKIASVAKLKTTSTRTITYRNEHGEWASSDLPADEYFKDILCLYECSIEKPDNLSESFLARFNAICEQNQFAPEDQIAKHPSTAEQGALFELETGVCTALSESAASSSAEVTNGSIQNLVVHLLKQDLTATGTIESVLSLLFDAWPDKMYLRNVGKSISTNAVTFYRHDFPNDPELLLFRATMAECEEALLKWEDRYDFVPILAKSFNIYLSQKRLPNGQFAK